jgi:hypothetical protein
MRSRVPATMPDQRFTIDQQLRLRRLRDPQWYLACTVNVSRTGLLFTCDLPLQVGDQVEFCIVLHDHRGEETAALTRTTGRVVRVVDSPRGAAIEFSDRASAAGAAAD